MSNLPWKPCKICKAPMTKTKRMSKYNWEHKTTCSEPCRAAYRNLQKKSVIWYGHDTLNLQPLLCRAFE